MATANQTARQKFIEARKSGVDPVTARKQAYGEVAPAQSGVVQAQPTTAPVAGQPPTPTPTPTAPTQGSFNEQTQGMNVAERQAVRQSTVATTTEPTTTPTPTPTPESVTPQKTTQTTPVDKTAEIQAQTEAKLVENQQKAQLEEVKRQTIAQETAKANVPTNQQDILNQMISGIGVQPQKTQAFRAAQFQFAKYSRLNAMTPSQLQTSLKNGDIPTDMDRLLSSNSNYLQAKQKYEEEKKIETLNNTMRLATGTKKEEEIDPLQALSDRIIKSLNIPDQTYEDAYTTYVSKNPQIVQYTEQLSGLNRDIAQTTQRINDGFRALSEAKGDMPDGAFILYSQSQMREATDYLNALNNTRTYLEADLRMAMEMGKDQYDAVSKDIDNALNQRNAVISQAIQQQFSIAGKQAEADLAKKVAKESLNDPATAIANVMKTYQEMGIPFTQSIQTKVADAEDYIAKGGDLAGYLDKMIKDIQAKPEFQAYQSKQSGTEWQSTNITRYNPSTGANESTPIFYRKKTSGGFEAVDLAGNPIDVNTLTGWVGTTGTTGTLPTSFTGDTTSYIASKEGFRAEAYDDANGKVLKTGEKPIGVATIGYGTTSINGKPVQPGQTITQEEAQKLLNEDIAKHSKWKKFIDENTLSPSQKTALASFEYNLGPGIWEKSAMNIIDMVKSGDLAGAGAEMQRYNQAGGKVIKGLQNRRAEEAQLLQTTGASTTGKTFTPLQTKEFETYDGKTIPAQYKTPLEQDQFVKDYNEWRLSSISNQIKTGEDILKVQLSDKATEQEKNAIQYGSRMLNAINDLGELEDVYSRLPLKDQIYQEYAPSIMKSDNQKKLESRKKDFITAVLRKESGASIAESEFKNEEKKYFAQPGDSSSVIAAKQNARNFAIKAILSAAGKDVNGKAISSLYNPEAIKPGTNNPETGESTQDRIKRIRNQK